MVTLCRACWESKSGYCCMRDLVNDQDVRVKDMYLEVCNLLTLDEEFLCPTCYFSLCNAYEFKKQYLISQRKLQNKIEQAATIEIPSRFLRPRVKSRIENCHLMAPPDLLVSLNTPESRLTSSGENKRIQLPSKKKSKTRKTHSSMRKSSAPRSTLNSDGTDLFFMSMCKTVKALPKQDQARIKSILLAAISEAQKRQAVEYNQ